MLSDFATKSILFINIGSKKHLTTQNKGFYRVPPRRPPPPPPLMNSGLLVAKETLITLPLNSFPVLKQREKLIELPTTQQQVQENRSDVQMQAD